MQFNVTLREPYLSQIIDGRKTVEGRINSGQFRRIRRGDNISFYNRSNRVECKVVKVLDYNSFAQMLTREGVEKCLPGCSSLSEGIRIYNSIPSYADRARQHGVVAIIVERLLPNRPAKRARENDSQVDENAKKRKIDDAS